MGALISKPGFQSLKIKVRNRLEGENFAFWWFEKLYKVLGFWSTEETGFLFHLRRCTIYFTLFLAFFSPVLIFTHKREDLIDRVKAAFSFLVASVTFAYTFVMLLRMDDVKTSIENLARIRSSEETMSHDEKSIRGNIENHTRNIIVFLNSSLFMIIIAILALINKSIKTRSYPAKLWLPYDASVSPNFELTVVIAVYVAFYNLVFMSWSKALHGFLYVFLIGEFKILQINIENIRATAIENVKSRSTVQLQSLLEANGENEPNLSQSSTPADVESGLLGSLNDLSQSMAGSPQPQSELDERGLEPETSSTCSDDVGKEMEALLKKYIREHQILLDYLSQHEDFLGSLMLADTLFCLLTCVLSSFLLAKLESRSVHDEIMLVAAIGNLIAFHLKCYLVDRLSSESSKVGDAAYACEWQDASKEFKRCLRVLITRANVPFVLSGLGFVDFSMKTFDAVIQTAYSYYTVIRDMDKKYSH